MSFLDDAVNFEQESYDQGFSEGSTQGAIEGRREGLETGFEPGYAFGHFFGEIYGYCLYLKAKLVKNALSSFPQSGAISARALITLDQLLKMCQELPLENTDVASQQFDKITSKYKLLLAQTQNPDASSSATKQSSLSY